MVPRRVLCLLASLFLALPGASVLAGDGLPSPPPDAVAPLSPGDGKVEPKAAVAAPVPVRSPVPAGAPSPAGAAAAAAAPAPARAAAPASAPAAPGSAPAAAAPAPARAPAPAAPPPVAAVDKAAPPPAPPPASRPFVDDVTGLSFVYVKGGCFRMGNPDPTFDADERPVHEVCLSPYWLSATEVTQSAWSKVMGWVPSTFKADGRNPVEGISWDDAQAFVSRMAEMTGRPFRLPTEAEWEFAARGGAPAGAGKEQRLVDVAWYDEMSDRSTHPVAELDPNPLGLYDIQGNVWEWCSDWYDGEYYRSSPKKDPKGPLSGPGRVLRGGSWADPPMNQRATERGVLSPSDRSATHGFRPALSY